MKIGMHGFRLPQRKERNKTGLQQNKKIGAIVVQVQTAVKSFNIVLKDDITFCYANRHKCWHSITNANFFLNVLSLHFLGCWARFARKNWRKVLSAPLDYMEIKS